jgi:UDP-galactopyranose mutase
MRVNQHLLNSDAGIELDLVCFSHLRWDFVYQRPQHLISRFARQQRVFFIEEPIFDSDSARFEISERENGLQLVVPHLPGGRSEDENENELRRLLDGLIAEQGIKNFVAWYYTPMMLGWTDHLEPAAIVFDCMDELSAFKNAPEKLLLREAELMSIADLVFTGGESLYEAKRDRHSAVYCFPSSIDRDHFATALEISNDPEDQRNIKKPRIGFFGVIDERTDIEMLRAIAELRPDWNFVMIGPVVKISEEDLPRHENIHYLGGKKYEELPSYIAGWDAAMMPFALNESTKFISPTKTPEYLAAGAPVVSTPITDVIRPYGEMGLVRIASTPQEFVEALELAMGEDHEDRLKRVNEFLEGNSWDKTFRSMNELIDDVVSNRTSTSEKTSVTSV